MNLFAKFLSVIKAELEVMIAEGFLPSGLDLSRITTEPPREAGHGDMATNAAMVLAKPAGKPPRQIAEALAARLKARDGVTSAEVAGPGFINLRLADNVWHELLHAALAAGDAYGRSSIGKGIKSNVEYVSANPTGPLHVGHCRGAVFGDALASLLETAGYDVAREYYINDAGAQIDVLARSVYLRYKEALGDVITEIPAGLYPGDYLKPVGEALAAEHGDGLRNWPEERWLPLVRDKAIMMMMELIRSDLAALDIRQETFFSEASLHTSGAVAQTVAELEKAGLVYKGRLPPPKGEVPEDWEDREQTLFRSSQFGDDTDRPLKKSDGSYTYFASDVAYSRDKIERGFNELIYVLGADHGGYVKRLEAVGAANAVGRNHGVEVIVRLCQLVKLFRNGEPVRMSKRAGEFVTVRDVVDEVGSDVIRFMMLFRKNEAPLDFDFAKVTEQSKENPVFYVQYAHARICSVLRNAEAAGAGAGAVDFALLTDESEGQLIRRLAEYPKCRFGNCVASSAFRYSSISGSEGSGR